MPRTGILVGACLLATAIGGCAPAPASKEAQQVFPKEQSTPAPAPGPGTAMSEDLQSLVAAAMDDAAGRLNRDRSTLTVERAEAVTWADGSLGCPAPGMAYTQALVPGYRILLRAGDELLDYHASARGQLLLCPAGRAIEPIADDRI